MKFCILLTVLVLVGIFYIQVEAQDIDCLNHREKSGDYCKELNLDAEPCKVHKRMTNEEVQEIFQTTHNAVPDYEVVQFDVSRLVKRGTRSARALRVKAFGGDLKLWLQPTEGILAGKKTPVLIAKIDSRGRIVYKDYPNAMKNVGKLLEDAKMKASVIVGTNSKGLYSINGHIASKNLVVRSLPESISDDLIKTRTSGNSSSTKSKTTRSAYHVVFKREVKRIEESNKSVKILGLNETRTRLSRSPNSVPEVVYPEIMVVVDSTLLALNGNDIDKVLAYVVTFWNGVDLFYRSFEGPKFRFNIARVIVAKKQDAVPYISRNMVNPTIFNAHHALRDVARFYFALRNKFTDDSYDAVVTLSRLDMTERGDKSDVLGISAHGGACEVNQGGRAVLKVALVTDTGSFDGVFTAAHEFGHLLDAEHDDGPTCKPEDGYIMSTESEITDHSHDFSDCTVKNIQTWLDNGEGNCLYNVPKTTDPLPRILPGQLRNRDYQCKMLGMGNSCYNEANKDLPCTAIYCTDPEDSSRCFMKNHHAPADGVFCSTGKVCLHGQCVSI